MKLRTVQSNAIRTLIEGLKDILTDTTFQFSPEGIKLLCMDGNHVSLVSLKLEAENFEYFKCENTFKIGLNISNFHKLIKTVSNNDTITANDTETESHSTGTEDHSRHSRGIDNNCDVVDSHEHVQEAGNNHEIN